MTNTSSKSKEELFQLLLLRQLGLGRCIDWAVLEQVQLVDHVRAFITTALWDQFFSIIEPTYMELTLEFCSTFILQHVMMTHDEPGTITFRLGGLVRQISVPEFGSTLRLYTEEFISAENFLRLRRHIHYLPFRCWTELTACMPSYDASRSKATSLPLAIWYLYALLAHTLTDRSQQEGSYLFKPLCDSTCSTFRSPRHIGVVLYAYTRQLDVPTGNIEHDTYEDDQGPPHPPPSSHRPIFSAATLADLSERFTCFKQYCFQRFVSIDAALQQICQHLHISSLTPMTHDINFSDDKDH
ncbi:hypothetical protein PVK06_034680 [Gossypium arboreum]|uniref:Uncharacterized protein n=1 Tax=Gossypium arboreum TaxID=29729 RepID=A0ABR0NEX0_GOSAR|nr:hypothetical protein PVK06_034680 [Gossypium arboreum]